MKSKNSGELVNHLEAYWLNSTNKISTDPNVSNKEIVGYFEANPKSNLSALVSNIYISKRISELEDIRNGTTDSKAPSIELYSQPGSTDQVGTYKISQTAINAICNWRTDKKDYEPSELVKVLEKIRDAKFISSNLFTVLTTYGKAPLYNFPKLLSSAPVRIQMGKLRKEQQATLDNQARESEKLDTEIENAYRNLKIENELDGKKVTELWQKYVEDVEKLSDIEDKSLEVIKKLSDYLSSFVYGNKSSGNKVIDSTLSAAEYDVIQVATIINRVEMVDALDAANNSDVEIDRIKEMEESFAIVKEKYEKLMKSKEAKKAAKDNRAVHAILKTCGGLLSGAAFIIGGLTKLAGTFIPGATLYTPYTAKLAKHLRRGGKLAMDAGSPLSAKSSKEIKKELAKEGKLPKRKDKSTMHPEYYKKDDIKK